MTINTDFIVLHITKFGESSVVVHTLCKEYGRRSFLVQGIGKKKIAMSIFLPLNIIEADIVESTKSTLYVAKNLSPKYHLNGIRDNIYKNSITMFVSEVLYRTVREGMDEPGLYEWAEKSILMLNAIEADFSNYHLKFLLELAGQLGFQPKGEDLKPFLGENYQLVMDFMRLSFADFLLMPMNGVLRNNIAEAILHYIEYHLDYSLNIQSLKVLRELFT